MSIYAAAAAIAITYGAVAAASFAVIIIKERRRCAKGVGEFLQQDSLDFSDSHSNPPGSRAALSPTNL